LLALIDHMSDEYNSLRSRHLRLVSRFSTQCGSIQQSSRMLALEI
jgi:hypothetical protein